VPSICRVGTVVPSSISDPVAIETNPRGKGILLEGDPIVPATATALGAGTSSVKLGITLLVRGAFIAQARRSTIRNKYAVTVSGDGSEACTIWFRPSLSSRQGSVARR
jgi:hypothetical protein